MRDRLNSDQLATLKRYGWLKPNGSSARNLRREWRCALDEERRTVAAIAVRTLIEVYGHYPGEDVPLELILNK